MKGFLKSKIVMTIAAFLIIAAAVVVPLSASITHSRAQAPSVLSCCLLTLLLISAFLEWNRRSSSRSGGTYHPFFCKDKR
jgi:hypothetical protein